MFIVEDDYLADLERDGKANLMYSYDDSSHVIYLKSYSKIIFPGLRVGVAVIPNGLTEIFFTYKKLLDIDSSMISQAALEVYIKSGMFDRHKQRIRTSYYERSKRLAASLKEWSSTTKQLFQYLTALSNLNDPILQIDKQKALEGKCFFVLPVIIKKEKTA